MSTLSEREARPGGRRALQKEATRAAILAAARAVIREEGLRGATTRKIAARAGVAAGTVFVHFADVDALGEALLHDQIEAALRRGFATLRSGALVDDLVHVARALYASYAAEPELSREFLKAGLFRADPEGPLARQLRRFEGWMVVRIGRAIADGEVAAIEPRLGFLGFFSLYFAVLVGGLRGELSVEGQAATLAALLRRFFDGVGAGPAEPGPARGGG